MIFPIITVTVAALDNALAISTVLIGAADTVAEDDTAPAPGLILSTVVVTAALLNATRSAPCM